MLHRTTILRGSILLLAFLAMAGRTATAQPRAVTSFSAPSLLLSPLVPVTDSMSGEAAVAVAAEGQLWRVDTEAASALTSFEDPGSMPHALTVVGGQIFFTSGPGELWRSTVFDGGVAQVGSFTCLTGATSFEDQLYFVGWKGEVEGVFAVNHLYRTDGGAVEQRVRVPPFATSPKYRPSAST